MKRGSLAILIAVLALSTSRFSQGESELEVKVSKSSLNEQYERDVDEVALSSQDKAIASLATLLKKYRSTSQEPTLLSKLADLQQQNAAILFRIAHGLKKKTDLTRFTKAMKQSIETLDTLIKKYPGYQDVPHAYYTRGKGYEELGNKTLAAKDYIHLTTHFPDAEEAPSAFMALAEFAIEAGDHRRAITYLKEVEKKPEDPRFPFALYKLAWSYYNLKDVPLALSYAERQITYYNNRKTSTDQGQNATSDSALKENTLSDLAVFYFEGYEQTLPDYQLANALPYFKKIESGPMLGKILLRFAKLLRSHSHESDLVRWKDQVLVSESDRPESLETLLITYEFQVNKRRYPQLAESSQDIFNLYQKGKRYEAFSKAQKLLLDTAEGLQLLIVKNKDTQEVHALSVTLATIYDVFTKIVDEKDPRIPQVHYNLAETLFTIKDYSGATGHYRWVVDHESWSEEKPKHGINIAEVSLKAIASRYEVLRQKQLIPTEVVAKPFSSKHDEPPLDSLLAQWIEWIDTHAKHDRSQDADNFIFEANRSLYSHGHYAKAVRRLEDFSRKSSRSTYAVPSASLVLDSYIANADWLKTQELADEFSEIPEWKSGDFSKRLLAVASDAYYKQIEILSRSRDFKGALKNSDNFFKRYPKAERTSDCLVLAGNAAVETNEKMRAAGYFGRIIKETTPEDTGNLSVALLTRAGILEDKYLFARAAGDYKSYLNLPVKKTFTPEDAKADGKLDVKIDALRKKVLTLFWLSGDFSEVRAALDSKSVCVETLEAECTKFRALTALATPGMAQDSKTTDDAFEKARNSTGETRTLWATLALEGSKNLVFRDRNLILKMVAQGWEELDPLVKFSILPSISVSISKAFHLNRLAMREVAPLRADERYITRRVEVIREMENAGARVLKLPWSRVRAQVINETAGLYLDLAQGLATLSPPKSLNEAELQAYEQTIRKLVLPFEEKGQDMRARAFEIASRFAIEDEAFQSIVLPFFTENPSQAKKLRPAQPVKAPVELNLAYLDGVDPNGEWEKTVENGKITSDDPELYIKSLWASALKARRWQQVAFFMQEAQEKALIQAGVMATVKAISLASVGARGEALSELAEARRDLKPEERLVVSTTLLQYYLSSFDREKTKNLLKDIQSEQAASGADQSIIAQAKAFVTVEK